MLKFKLLPVIFRNQFAAGRLTVNSGMPCAVQTEIMQSVKYVHGGL